jgi:hypothetical protein
MAELLSQAELTQFRNLVRDLAMPGTAMILRGTLIPNGLGGYAEAWGTVAVNGTVQVACRYGVTSAAEREQAGGIQALVQWSLVFPAQWDIRQADRVYIYGEHRILAVDQVTAPKTWEIQRRVQASEDMNVPLPATD